MTALMVHVIDVFVLWLPLFSLYDVEIVYIFFSKLGNLLGDLIVKSKQNSNF